MRRLTSLSPRQRLLMGGAAGGLIILVIVWLLIASAVGAGDEQPIAFEHNTHAKNGIQCQFCHTGVYRSTAAGIPSIGKCMGCHTYIATDSNKINKLARYWERQAPIPWRRVNQQPSYVYFNHASHVSASTSCGACHGDVANMTVAERAAHMNMGFCLDCHAEQDCKDALYDCAVCHR